MKKISFIKVVISGILYAIVAQIIHTIGAMVSMGYYMMEEYFSVWSKIMMPTAGPPPLSFTIYSLLFSFIGGVLIALVYSVIKKGIPGKTIVKKGMMYGLLLFLAAAVPGYLSIILLINLPTALVALWAVESLVIYLLGGMIIAKLNK